MPEDSMPLHTPIYYYVRSERFSGKPGNESVNDQDEADSIYLL